MIIVILIIINRINGIFNEWYEKILTCLVPRQIWRKVNIFQLETIG